MYFYLFTHQADSREGVGIWRSANEAQQIVTQSIGIRFPTFKSLFISSFWLLKATTLVTLADSLKQYVQPPKLYKKADSVLKLIGLIW